MFNYDVKGDIMSYFIILLTLAYASLGSFIRDNFTTIGNQEGHFWHFFVWTILIACYFFYYTKKVFNLYHYSFKHENLIASYVMISLITTPLIPYTETNPLLDDLHVFLAMSSCIVFIGIWLSFLWYTKKTNPTLSQQLELPLQMIIYTTIALIFIFNRINSIVEIVFVLSLIILIEFLLKNVKKGFTK